MLIVKVATIIHLIYNLLVLNTATCVVTLRYQISTSSQAKGKLTAHGSNRVNGFEGNLGEGNECSLGGEGSQRRYSHDLGHCLLLEEDKKEVLSPNIQGYRSQRRRVS